MEQETTSLLTRTLPLGRTIKMDLPSDWVSGECEDDKGKWWSGPPGDQRLSLFVNEDILAGAAAPTRGDRDALTAESALTTIKNIANQQERAKDFKHARTASSDVVAWTLMSGESDYVVRSQIWYVIEKLASQVAVRRYVLEMPAEYQVYPRVQKIIDLISSQIADEIVDTDLYNDLDYDALREHTFGNTITFSFPDAWRIRSRGKAAWEIKDTATPCALWFTYHNSKVSLKDLRNGIRPLCEQEAKLLVKRAADQSIRFVMQDRVFLKDGAILLWVEDESQGEGNSQDENGPKRIFTWHYMKLVGSTLVRATFAFMLPIRYLQLPKFRNLVPLLAKQVRDTKFDL